MDPEVSAILAVYQKRLNDVTQQAIAYEARIQVLQLQIQQMQAQPPAPAAEPAKAPARSRKKSAEATDAGTF